MDNPENFPVLIHCFAGIHRTGAFCAIYRMEYEHWTNERAIVEVKANGYNTLEDDWDILTYLERYRPRWRGPATDAELQAKRNVDFLTLKHKSRKRQW